MLVTFAAMSAPVRSLPNHLYVVPFTLIKPTQATSYVLHELCGLNIGDVIGQKTHWPFEAPDSGPRTRQRRGAIHGVVPYIHIWVLDRERDGGRKERLYGALGVDRRREEREK